MKLSEEAIQEFRSMWAETFGHELPLDQARAGAEQVLTMFTVIFRPRNESHKDRDPP